MSKAYSNKALPAGTVLREWRLEQVLGVGGFGIVYRGRGIYFDELVAIKEYFPSSISERVEDDTVVPIDSDAEEVHALGLKKFVEEAKLLWNLSTPTRHPNIVSVRSLFEIHGTAYMVMDFEDGVSLSKLLKQGQRWNEASLSALFKPIAEGLDRAHRVGVLHRDIKPPNILINEDGRPVLIDFGSARFESGDATSTKVTFHTPPYAAIEQYVRTFEQGPWTDIYALGVVLYECITGTKPAEVLERMHGGAGKALTAGEWPGYSRKFLRAVDAAMGIRPSDRPQSIAHWLALFDAPDELEEAAPPAEEFDGDATQVAAFSKNEQIVPVAAPLPGFTRGEKIETPVPDDTSEVRFKLAGEDTGTSTKARKKEASDEALMEPPPPAPEATPEPVEPEREPAPELPAEPPAAAPVEKEPPGPAKKRKLTPLLIGGGVLALAVLAAGSWYVLGGGRDRAPDPAMIEVPLEVVPVDIEAAGGMGAAVQALADDAAKAQAPAAAIARLTAAAKQIEGMGALPEAATGPVAIKAAGEFSAAIVSDAETRSRRVARDLPWASPFRTNAAAGESAERQRRARDIRSALAALRTSSQAASAATDPAAALTSAREVLARNAALNSAITSAYRAGNAPPPADILPAEQAADTAAVAPSDAPAAAETATAAPQASGPAGNPRRLFPAKFRNFNSIVDSARDLADDVIRLGRGSAPGSDAAGEEVEAFRIRQTNAQTARGYDTYLDGLENSMRGDRTEAEVDLNIANAERTRGYLRGLLEESRAARGR